MSKRHVLNTSGIVTQAEANRLMPKMIDPFFRGKTAQEVAVALETTPEAVRKARHQLEEALLKFGHANLAELAGRQYVLLTTLQADLWENRCDPRCAAQIIAASTRICTMLGIDAPVRIQAISSLSKSQIRERLEALQVPACEVPEDKTDTEKS